MLKLCSKQQFSLEKLEFSDKQKARIPYKQGTEKLLRYFIRGVF